jgi:hypothetical protein
MSFPGPTKKPTGARFAGKTKTRFIAPRRKGAKKVKNKFELRSRAKLQKKQVLVFGFSREAGPLLWFSLRLCVFGRRAAFPAD